MHALRCLLNNMGFVLLKLMLHNIKMIRIIVTSNSMKCAFLYLFRFNRLLNCLLFPTIKTRLPNHYEYTELFMFSVSSSLIYAHYPLLLTGIMTLPRSYYVHISVDVTMHTFLLINLT